MNPLVVGADLQVGHAFGEDLALKRLPIGGLDGPASGCLGECHDKYDENARDRQDPHSSNDITIRGYGSLVQNRMTVKYDKARLFLVSTMAL
ncbi:MAG: hypothetical protein ACRD9W_23880, partial [Terriglobia bacterium]